MNQVLGYRGMWVSPLVAKQLQTLQGRPYPDRGHPFHLAVKRKDALVHATQYLQDISKACPLEEFKEAYGFDPSEGQPVLLTIEVPFENILTSNKTQMIEDTKLLNGIWSEDNPLPTVRDLDNLVQWANSPIPSLGNDSTNYELIIKPGTKNIIRNVELV